MKFFVLIVVCLMVCAVNFVKTQSGSACTTPNGESAKCISIYTCKNLFAILNQQRLSSQTEFLRASFCGYDKEPLVCCGSESDFRKPTTTTEADVPIEPGFSSRYDRGRSLLPTANECGRPSDSSRVINGEETDLDEFPWMALLIYEKYGKFAGFMCGGSLISHRYVLTAAHCVVGYVTKVGTLSSVRLGEHDFATDVDCLPNSGCADPHIDVKIEKKIIHPNYEIPSERYQVGANDVALLRLEREVPFTFYVAPICLPDPDIGYAKPGDKLVITGWGKTENARESTKKLKAIVRMVDLNNCFLSLRNAGASVAIQKEHICTEGVNGTDTCTGDSGGPLMMTQPDRYGHPRWYAEGIVSFGYRHCGRDDIPSVYVKVSEYINWITGHMRP